METYLHVPNFNFLARLVSDIWRGSHNKNWGLLISPCRRHNFFHRALVPIHTYRRTKFQRSTSITFQEKDGVPKFNMEAITYYVAPCCTPCAETFICAPMSTVCEFQHRSCTMWIKKLDHFSFENNFGKYCPILIILSLFRHKLTTTKRIIQELSYRKQIARQLRTQYVDGIYDNPVTLKSSLTIIQGHWKRKHWEDHTRLTISRVIGRWILSWPWNVGQRSFRVIEISAIRKAGWGFLFAFYSNFGRICIAVTLRAWLQHVFARTWRLESCSANRQHLSNVWKIRRKLS